MSCDVQFDTDKSLDVHLRYHQENLLRQWACESQEKERNNRNNKAGKHNARVKRETVTAPENSSESSSKLAFQNRTFSEPAPSLLSEQQEQQPQQSQQHFDVRSYMQYQAEMFSEPSFLMNDQAYILPPQSYTTPVDNTQTNGGGVVGAAGAFPRYHPYHHPPYQPEQHRTTSVSSASPRTPPHHCDKCGAMYEDANQLSEHVQASHPNSPGDIAAGYSGQRQYQQLGNSPQQQQQQIHVSPQHVHVSPQQVHASSQQVHVSPQQVHASPQQVHVSPQQVHASPQHMHSSPQDIHNSPQHISPPLSSQQQSAYEYNNVQSVKIDMKQEQDEPTEILDLDSHKVQTHRYHEEMLRTNRHEGHELFQNQLRQMEEHFHQQQQLNQTLNQLHHQQQIHQQIQQQIQHHQQQQRPHSVSSMLNWTQAIQSSDYPEGLSPIGAIGGSPPLPDQNQFIRGQHMPVEPPRHPGSPIITSTQQILSQQVPGNCMPQSRNSAPLSNQSWKSNEARRPKTYNCCACNKWFTSSGHLKRHYNTTLHKNAVKQSNQPDPATMPISAHHHPGRDQRSNSNNKGAGTSRSPESSVSPPNLMAGPSGEAARGLLHTPNNPYTSNHNSNNNNNNNNSSSGPSMLPNVLTQYQQQSGSMTHLANMTTVPSHNSPAQSPLASHNQQQMNTQASQLGHQQQQMNTQASQLGHQQQQMDIPSAQLGQQQQQQFHHLPMSSLDQSPVPRPMTSPISPMHLPLMPHLNSPSQMVSSHPQHMNSVSTITQDLGLPMGSSAIGDTMMQHQSYPNDLPPRVTSSSTLTLGLIKLDISGRRLYLQKCLEQVSCLQWPQEMQQRQQGQEILQEQCQAMLPCFNTIKINEKMKPLPSFTHLKVRCLADQNPSLVLNVGGLNGEEYSEGSSQEMSYELPESNFHPYRNFMPTGEPLANLDSQQNIDRAASEEFNMEIQDPIAKAFINLCGNCETNNNDLNLMEVKQELNPDVNEQLENILDNGKENIQYNNNYQVSSTSANPHDSIPEEKVHECKKCNKVFNKRCYLTQHNKSFHCGEKPFKCVQCGKRFKNFNAHDEHKRKHQGEKPFKCDVCPKQFNHKTDLRRHLCLHTGEKPFVCDICNKGFIRKDHMVKHRKTHFKNATQTQQPPPPPQPPPSPSEEDLKASNQFIHLRM